MTDVTKHKIYVASSWRNPIQPDVVRALRSDGHDVYDFRNPAADEHGFSWRQTSEVPVKEWTPDYFVREVLEHPVAVKGFALDMTALRECSACVLVLPCGRSAHLELGYAVGKGRLTIVYMPVLNEPELMYRMCDHVETTLDGVRRQLSRDRSAECVLSMEELIEGSSLGTPEVKAACERVPREVVERVLARADELDELDEK